MNFCNFCNFCLFLFTMNYNPFLFVISKKKLLFINFYFLINIKRKKNILNREKIDFFKEKQAFKTLIWITNAKNMQNEVTLISRTIKIYYLFN